MMLAALDIEPTQPLAEAQAPSAAVPAPASAEQQLEQIIREHAAAVRDILRPRYRGGLNASDIDDVVAVAAHRLWIHRAEFTRLRSPRAWFVRIADNVARDVLRFGWQKARQLEIAAEKSYLESFSPADSTAAPSNDPTPDPERAQKVRDLVDQLPEKQRKIIWADALSRSGNIAAEDLARELDIPTGTVRVYRKRALDRLRKLLTEHGLAPDS
jgi:RNA polymerase sigma factor (sigma-70 family)